MMKIRLVLFGILLLTCCKSNNSKSCSDDIGIKNGSEDEKTILKSSDANIDLRLHSLFSEIESLGFKVVFEKIHLNHSTIPDYCDISETCHSETYSDSSIEYISKRQIVAKSYFIYKVDTNNLVHSQIKFGRIDELEFTSKDLVSKIRENFDSCFNCNNIPTSIQVKYLENKLLVFLFFEWKMINKLPAAKNDLNELSEVIDSF